MTFKHFRIECERVQQEVSHAKDRERELLLQQMDFEKGQEMKAIHDRWTKEEQQMQNEVSYLTKLQPELEWFLFTSSHQMYDMMRKGDI